MRRRSRPAQAQIHTRPPALVEVDHDLVVRLRPEAARREVSVNRLIRDLLDIIVDDKLTTAILDD
jgi:hypothetical protein